MALTDYNRSTMGDVEAHVAPVAEEVCERWPCAFVWGKAYYDDPDDSSQHDDGLALDFSVLAYGNGVNDPGPADADKGDAIAAYLVEHRERLNVTYVIWDRRIASPRSDPDWSWRDYDGSNPHTDHVHVSLAEDGTYRPPEEPVTIDRSDLADYADQVEAHVTQRTYARVNDRDRERYGYRQNLYQVGNLTSDASVNTRELLIRSVRTDIKLDALTELVRGRSLTDAELDAIEQRVEQVLDDAGLLGEPTDVGTVEGGGPDGPTQD